LRETRNRNKPTKCDHISRPFRELSVSVKIYDVGFKYEVWNFNSGNYLFTTDTK